MEHAQINESACQNLFWTTRWFAAVTKPKLRLVALLLVVVGFLLLFLIILINSKHFADLIVAKIVKTVLY